MLSQEIIIVISICVELQLYCSSCSCKYSRWGRKNVSISCDILITKIILFKIVKIHYFDDIFIFIFWKAYFDYRIQKRPFLGRLSDVLNKMILIYQQNQPTLFLLTPTLHASVLRDYPNIVQKLYSLRPIFVFL